jgi:nitroimidazol reductase NimA-like FMN-containing flavoprotein (pyridoxamine 5'-phosphate oxidase superfamily)
MNTTGIRPTTPLATLTEAEAIALLGTQDVGRLVFTRWALPAVTPVNFVLRDGAIWIWTASTSSMWQAVRGSVVAFEVDQLDAGTRSGWSVVVLGVAELVTRPEEIERARRYGPEPWIPGRKEHLLKIPLKLVSGRRIVPGEPDGSAFEGLSDESPLAHLPEGR